MIARIPAGSLKAALTLMALAAVGSVAQAATLNLTAFNDDSVTGLDMSVDIAAGGGSATFTFANNSFGDAADSVLARIYFESGLAGLGLSNGAVTGGSGVKFVTGYPGPDNPPAGNNIGWAGNAVAFGAAASPSQNGLRVGDELILTFDYSGTLDALVAAVSDMSGTSRIAGHVLDCNNGDSCAAVAVVPVPAALPLLLGGLASLGFLRSRRRLA